MNLKKTCWGLSAIATPSRSVGGAITFAKGTLQIHSQSPPKRPIVALLQFIASGLILTTVFALSVAICASAASSDNNSTSVVTTSSGQTFADCYGCPRMTVIPAGSFEQPSMLLTDSTARPDAKPTPPHTVKISSAFAVSTYPVTKEEYRRFVMATNRKSALGCKVWDGNVQWKLELEANWENPGFPQTERDPVVCVNWEDAQAYVQWLNAISLGRNRLYYAGIDGPYRLPTLDELQYIAFGGNGADSLNSQRRDDSVNSGAADCNPCSGIARGRDRWLFTSPVGSFPANTYGVYDILGNVSSLTDSEYQYPSPGESATAMESSNPYLVMKFGGSWLYPPSLVGDYSVSFLVEATNDTGFRVVKALVHGESTDAPSAKGSSLSATRASKVSLQQIQVDIPELTTGQHFRECKGCPEMVALPAGDFWLSPQRSLIKPEWKDKRVRIANPIAMGAYDVTVAQYAMFVKETGYSGNGGCELLTPTSRWQINPRANWRNPGFKQTGDHPVVCVSWEDAHAYISWLNNKVHRQSGREQSGPYRLPSFEEWEYAARSGSPRSFEYNPGFANPWGASYYWGPAPSHNYANYGLDMCGSCGGATEGRDRWLYTSPVGAFPPNAFGLYDMFGDVWQPTEDCLHKGGSLEGNVSITTQGSEPLPRDGSAWTEGGDCRYRWVYGGSYDDEMPFNFGPIANIFRVDIRNSANGFRVVRELVEK